MTSPAHGKRCPNWRSMASRSTKSPANWSRTACGNSPTRSTSFSPRWRSSAASCSKASAPVSRSGPARRRSAPHSIRKWSSGARRAAFDGCGRATRRCGRGPTRTNGSAGCMSSSRSSQRRRRRFAEMIRQRGFADVVLLGMGGSSLGPEVLAEIFGPQSGWPRFHMLDSTDPAQIKAVEDRSISTRRCSSFPPNPAARWSPISCWIISSSASATARGKDKAGGALHRRDRSRLVAGAARQEAPFCAGRFMARRRSAGAIPCCPIRPGAGGGHGPRRPAPAGDGVSKWSEAAARMFPRRTIPASGSASPWASPRRAWPRQGDDRRLARHRRFRRLAGAAAGREHRQAGAA